MARIPKDDKRIMIKKILLIFEPASQIHLVSNLLENMHERGLIIDAFNTSRWTYIKTKKEIPFFYRFLRRTLKFPQVGRVTRRLFQTPLLLCIARNYDFIDLHYFWRTFIPFIKKVNKPYKLTIWGSDFYRELPKYQELKKALYEKARIVQVETEDVERDVLQYDPKLNGHIAICNFGIDLISQIAQIKLTENIGNTCEKIIVTIGYNGSPGQQHFVLIDAISQLPEEYKKRINIYVPATYGLTKEYEIKLREELDRLNIPYTIFNKRLSEDDLIQLRCESDIVLNAQITDSFSASLIQHLCAGGVLIVGDWLPYGVFDRNGVFYFKSGLSNYTNNLKYCIDHLDELKESAKSNKQKVLGFASWESVSDKLFSIYKRAIE